MADKNQEGLNNIITAINNIVEPKINNSKFDRTFRAKVIKQADDEDYIVEINRIQYKLSYAGKLEPNQVVMVKAPLNNFSDIYIEPLPSSGGSGGTTNYDELVNKPALNTTISKKLNTNAKEVIKGTIELHKVSKTGSYKDLNDLPDLNFIPTSEKGAKSGVATLDSNIKVPTSQLPIATSDTLGVVKAGSNVSIAPDGTLSVNGITGNEITSVTVPGQITKLTKNDGTTFRTIGLNATSNNAQRNMWHNLGTFELLKQGNVGEIWIIGGDGQNSATYQNMWAHLFIKRGWQQEPSLEKYVGGTYEIFIPAGSINHYKDVKFKLLCKEVGKIDVWIYFPYPYSRSFYYPAGYYDSFTVVNTEQSEEPVTGSVYGTEQPCEGGFISPSADGGQTTISVIDNLNSTSTSDALSANMGRELNDNLSLLSNKVDNLSTLDDLQAGDNVTITKQGSNYKISSNYPGVATKTNLGLVKIGDNINISSDGTISASLGTVNYNDLENKPKLNTNNSESQSINASEEISGTINLHKVAKTGNYNDLLNTPTLPTKTSDLTNDGNGTANSKYITNTELSSSLSQKQDTITGGATTIVSDNLTKDKALVSDENGKVAVSNTTSDELGYLSGARSNLQTQIDNITTTGGQPNVIEVVQENGVPLEITNKTVNVTVPTKTSDLTNDSGFITNTVNDLTNYYLKSETYTQTEVNNLIGQIKTISIEVVNELPTTGEDNKIYLVPKEGTTQDIYNEYLWINNSWELIGSTQIDLTGYATETWVNNQIKDFLNETQVTEIVNNSLVNYYTKTQTDNLLKDKANTSDIPTKVSELDNDSGFITNSVDNLTNYYKKTETYNQTEVNNLLSNKANTSDIPTKISELENDSGFTSNEGTITGVSLNGKTVATSGIADITIGNATTTTDGFMSAADKTKLSGIEDNAQQNKIEKVQRNGTELTITNKTVNIEVPTKVSDLENDSNFINNTVDNLTNYYLKTETYTQTEVNNLIGQIKTISIEVVDTLPETGEDNKIYLVPKTGSTGDVYNEYIWVNNAWELIGSTQVDLANYYTKEQADNLLSNKQDKITGGATTITSDDLVVGKVLVSNSAGKVAVSDTTSDELGYLSGARSNLQSQIDSITTEGGQPNVIEVVQENGTSLEIINKTVNVIAPTNLVNGIAKGSLRGVNSTEESDSYKLGQNAFAIGVSTRASGGGSYAEGEGSLASGDGSHAEGGATTASGICSHAEGQGTTASRDYSHAEGQSTTASGICSHAEGQGTTASGDYSHAEGQSTTASQNGSHAEGVETEATNGGHAEGFQTKATGDVSHAEGSNTIASGYRSHAEGLGTEAIGNQQHVQGRYNISDEYLAHIVGNGSEETKSNAYTLDWDGNAWYAGNVYVGSTSGANRDDGSKKLITIEDIPIASQTVLGKIKVGSNLSIASDGTLSAVRNN